MKDTTHLHTLFDGWIAARKVFGLPTDCCDRARFVRRRHIAETDAKAEGLKCVHQIVLRKELPYVCLFEGRTWLEIAVRLAAFEARYDTQDDQEVRQYIVNPDRILFYGPRQKPILVKYLPSRVWNRFVILASDVAYHRI